MGTAIRSITIVRMTGNSAVSVSFIHNMNRSFKGKPWMQMECSPSVQNWKPVNKLKRPGLHIVEGLQAVGAGSDTVEYFQWRKSRGGCEKFHGAVVDHCGNESVNTRVFKEVAELGRIFAGLDNVVGTTTKAQVAILYDWENRWAIDSAAGPRSRGRTMTGRAFSIIAHSGPQACRAMW